VRPWHEVEQEFNESEYRAIKERQMKELELEDDLLGKAPVRYVFHKSRGLRQGPDHFS
jgi:engulfment and cell motility protein 1